MRTHEWPTCRLMNLNAAVDHQANTPLAADCNAVSITIGKFPWIGDFLGFVLKTPGY